MRLVSSSGVAFFFFSSSLLLAAASAWKGEGGEYDGGYKKYDSKASRSDKKKGEGGGKGYKSRSKPKKPKPSSSSSSDEGRTIYETVDFEVDVICGTRDEVANDLETAFLAFFDAEDRKCDSDRDVESLVLVEFEQALVCFSPSSESKSKSKPKPKPKPKSKPPKPSPSSSTSKSSKSKSSKSGGGSGSKSSKGSRRELLDEGREEDGADDRHHPLDRHQRRRLQFAQRSEGRFNRRSTCDRCRRRRNLLLADDDISETDTDATEIGGYDAADAEDTEAAAEGPTRPRRLSKGGGKGESGKGGSKSSKSKSKPKKPKPSKSKPKKKPERCPVDLVDFLRDAGFDTVTEAEITRIREVDCSPYSKDCTSTKPTRGACCGVCGCACSFPSESLCEFNDFCVEKARPFDPDLCEDFGDTDGCRKKSCYNYYL